MKYRTIFLSITILLFGVAVALGATSLFSEDNLSSIGTHFQERAEILVFMESK